MNKKLMAIALALAIPLTAMAGDDSQAEAAKKAECLAKDLGLNAEQQAKIKTVFEQKEQKSKLLREEFHAQMQQILTPEQQTKMEEKHKRKDNKHARKNPKDCD